MPACEFCGKEYVYKRRLITHLRQKHSKRKDFDQAMRNIGQYREVKNDD